MANRVPLLEMKGICKEFPGVKASDQVNLLLQKGEVLALLGENGAGKSSLMNILVGIYRPDEGSIYYNGEEVEIHSPADAEELGIGMVHQEFMLIPNMTVAENVILGKKQLPLFPSIKEVEQEIRDLSAHYGIQVDPSMQVQNLSVGERQRVEILKLLYRGAEILVLDEPTAVLTPQESIELNKVIHAMTSEGKSAIFITHKMNEVMAFSQRVQVLAKGQTRAVKNTEETNPEELANLMVGRDVLYHIEKEPFRPGDPVLTVENLWTPGEREYSRLKGISLEVREGEILGIAGVAGNGQQELAEALTGQIKPESGKIRLRGIQMEGKAPIDFINMGVSYIPEDRGAVGSIGNMTVGNNLIMKGYRRPPMTHKGILQKSSILDFVKDMISRFQISTPTQDTQIKFLSGGNIQKTILAREIDACDGLMVAAYPSRGLDVGATESVRQQLIAQRDRGEAILLISEELDELLMMSDKLAVLHEGHIMGIMEKEQMNRDKIGLMMAGVKSGEKE